ncbi:MAG: alanine racemase, partial [Alphaproteobacteria bacterium]|nr:alanine racemase [Alphaproteobacteria bacterium]
MSRPAIAYLSGQNLRHNIAVIQAQTPHSKLIPMVKANAYGHGIVDISKRIDDLVSHFGVACTEEAIMLRKAGIQSNILLAQGPFEPEDVTLAQQYDCDLVIHDPLHLKWLDQIDHHPPQGRKLKTWIKVNTGMNRLGVRPDQVKDIYDFLKNHPGIDDHIP